MQAIIMAAGKGSRLGEMTADKPKSFLEVKGIKLIEYNIGLLHAYGIRDIKIVTGYMNEEFEKLAEKYEGITCIYNPFYEMVNVLGSFFVAQEYMTDDFVYMHADTLCTLEIFEEMINTSADMVLPVEYKLCDEEAMKVKTKNGNVVEISKLISCDEAEGEFIGIAKVSKSILTDLKKASKKLMQDKQFTSYFEGAIQYLIDNGEYDIKTTDTKKYFWGEVDFLEDYERVCANMPESLYATAQKEMR